MRAGAEQTTVMEISRLVPRGRSRHARAGARAAHRRYGHHRPGPRGRNRLPRECICSASSASSSAP